MDRGAQIGEKGGRSSSKGIGEVLVVRAGLRAMKCSSRASHTYHVRHDVVARSCITHGVKLHLHIKHAEP